MSDPAPVDASLPDDHHLCIRWSDDFENLIPLDLLRSKCPCATCVDEWTGEVKVRRDMFPGIGLSELGEVGNYAFRIMFSDGHDTGIFTFKLLRGLGEESRGEAPEDPFSV